MNAKISQDARACAGCKGKAKRVEPITVQSLVRDEARAALETDEGFRFCGASDCDAVYSQPATGAVIYKDDLTVDVFQKETSADRLVCYCFDHSVADVENDARLDGGGVIVADIEDKCRDGLDRCEIENPQGRCCLGNVRKVAKGASGAADTVAAESAAAEHDCCASDKALVPPAAESDAAKSDAAKSDAAGAPRDKGRWAAGAAVFAAVLSSACCWLPLALIGVGVSAGGLGMFFEAYRWLFLGATSLLLGAGFYYVYFRKPACAPGDACATPNRRLQRLNKVMLWVATVFVAGFALFPNYVGYVLAAGSSPTEAQAAETPTDVAAASGATLRTYAVAGMSCEGCVAGIESTLGDLPGVSSVAVSYDDKLARVTFAGDADDALVVAAIDELGYEAKVAETP